MNIGSLKVTDKPLCLAPMEDVTDQAFRLVCKRLGADVLYTEFTSSEAIIRHIPKALHKIEVSDEERPVAIQIFGGVNTSMEEAAAITESCNPDFIDINCGCYVKNHVARGEGAALLKDLPRFEEIVKATVRGTKLPVTVKTRLGWDQESMNILEVAQMVEQAGAKALTVHCRVRSQGHNGMADWEWLEKIKKVISIPLIGNGDIKTPEDVKRMFETGCDGVMIGRGAINNPWIFQQTKDYLTTGDYCREIPIADRIDVCIEHLRLTIEKKINKNPIFSFRKFYGGYIRGFPNISQLRSELMQLEDFDSVVECLNNYKNVYVQNNCS